MRLPIPVKALKLVAQGQSFSQAQQTVKDRRLAKALQVADQFVLVQEAGDVQLARQLASRDGSLDAQERLYAQASSRKGSALSVADGGSSARTSIDSAQGVQESATPSSRRSSQTADTRFAWAAARGRTVVIKPSAADGQVFQGPMMRSEMVLAVRPETRPPALPRSVSTQV